MIIQRSFFSNINSFKSTNAFAKYHIKTSKRFLTSLTLSTNRLNYRQSLKHTQSQKRFTSKCKDEKDKAPFEDPLKDFLRHQQESMKKLGVTNQKDYLLLLEKERKKQRQKNINSTVLYGISVIIAFIGLSYLSVPMYRIMCAEMGWGGQITGNLGNMNLDDGKNPKFAAERLKPINQSKRINVFFSGDLSGILPWEFKPQQREISVLPGETALCFYKAKNKSDKSIIGIATYTVSPAIAAQYFNKIQCFCFEEQQLHAGEQVDMPVFFFIDPDYATDPNLKGINDIVLHYTFFKAKYNQDGILLPESVTEGTS